MAVSRHSKHAPPISGSYLGIPRVFIKTDVDLFVKHLVDQGSHQRSAHQAEQ